MTISTPQILMRKRLTVCFPDGNSRMIVYETKLQNVTDITLTNLGAMVHKTNQEIIIYPPSVQFFYEEIAPLI